MKGVQFLLKAMACFCLFASLNQLYAQQAYVKGLSRVTGTYTSSGSFMVGLENDFDFGSGRQYDKLGAGIRYIWRQGLGVGTKIEGDELGLKLREGFGAEYYREIKRGTHFGIQYYPFDVQISNIGFYYGSSARIGYQSGNFQVGVEHARNGFVLGFLNPVPDKDGYSGNYTIDAGYYKDGKRGVGLMYFNNTNGASGVSVFFTLWKL